MRVIVQPIGKQRAEDSLSTACLALNMLQTIWRFELRTPVHGRESGAAELEAFSPDWAFDSLLEVQEMIPEGEESVLQVGSFRGRVDTKKVLSVYRKKEGKAILSEFWWPKNCPTSSAWITALANLALRHSTGIECTNENCLGHHSISTENLDHFLPRVSLCADCQSRLEALEPYRVDEIESLVKWLARAWFADLHLDELVKLNVPDLPVLERQVRRQVKKNGSDLFAPYRLVLIMHYLPDLIPFLEGLMELGAKEDNMALLVKPYPYGAKTLVGGYFAYHYPQLQIDYLSSLPPISFQLDRALDVGKGDKLIVIEDGGYIVPYLHENIDSYQDLCLGAVEQTTKGIRNDEALTDLKIPVVNVAKSKFKDDHEAPLVGKSIVYNIQRVMEEIGPHFPRKKAAVIGFGAIGESVAIGLRETLEMNVHVAESKSESIVKAGNLGFDVTKHAEQAMKDAFLVVGTTGGTRTSQGVTHTIGRRQFRALRHGAILVSASSDQIEFDVKELEAMASHTNRIKGVGTEYYIKRGLGEDYYLLIGDGYPINFFRGQGIPNQSIDPILTQLLLGAAKIATGDNSPGIMNDIADTLVIENGVVDDFLDVQR